MVKILSDGDRIIRCKKCFSVMICGKEDIKHEGNQIDPYDVVECPICKQKNEVK